MKTIISSISGGDSEHSTSYPTLQHWGKMICHVSYIFAVYKGNKSKRPLKSTIRKKKKKKIGVCIKMCTQWYLDYYLMHILAS